MRNSKLKSTLTKELVKKSISDSTSSENRPKTGEIKFGTKNRPETGEISFGGPKKKTGSYLEKSSVVVPNQKPKNSLERKTVVVPNQKSMSDSTASKIAKAAGAAYGDYSKKVNAVKSAIDAASKVAKYSKFK
jgi:hypothetical protein